MPEVEGDDPKTLLELASKHWEESAKPLLWLIYSAASLADGEISLVHVCARADKMVEEFQKRFIDKPPT